ncbi:hypothetical protein LCG56_20290 [Pseudomonas cannabina pv. alisalensis]|uniref:Uncharacterized protein n=1 Tax=Pseudomonas syringae pv. maculicola str. ES4326 TaxID=629265 RepID=A0A8T8BXA0_PSEYM|nr:MULTISPECIES: hypothetical protein [Pseudomonas syringae group]QHE95676.1 hypothetical protein PMA4326_002880 [Pseudomonas syringae pv. maculicola str. ES4326]UBY96307.1 hypothetical protein LCG56_20290 [Pseudomonas cannabina pv. alisalensis]
MKKIDSRIERNTLAFKTLLECLQHIHQSPEHFKDNKELIKSLKSQASTAALDLKFKLGEDEKTTTPMSLNTLKTYAEKILPTGFDGLNRLRVAALEALEYAERKEQRSNKRTKVGLSLRAQELEYKLAILQKTNMVLLQALNRALDDIKSVRDAPTNGVRALRASEAAKALSAIVSLNAPPFNKLTTSDQTTVVNLDEYRK